MCVWLINHLYGLPEFLGGCLEIRSHPKIVIFNFLHFFNSMAAVLTCERAATEALLSLVLQAYIHVPLDIRKN